MPIALRADFDAQMVRSAARRSKDGPQARRLLALAAIYEGARRTEAAKIGGVTLQIVRDWVVKFNAHGPDGLIDRKPPGQPPRLNDAHRAALAAPGRHRALRNVASLWQHDRRRGRSDLFLQQHPSHALGACQAPRALPRRHSYYGFNRPARACQAHRHDPRPSSGRRCHRPVQDSDARNADREPLVLFLREPRRTSQCSWSPCHDIGFADASCA